MFYCPKCEKFVMNFNRRDNQKYIIVPNMRGGYGRPIAHYLCECGNPLAGDMDIRGLSDDEEMNVNYAKDIITAYNEGGDYFEQGLLDYANKIANERIKNTI